MSYSVTETKDTKVRLVEIVNLKEELVARLDHWVGEIMKNGGYGDISICIENAGKRQIIVAAISDKVF